MLPETRERAIALLTSVQRAYADEGRGLVYTAGLKDDLSELSKALRELDDVENAVRFKVLELLVLEREARGVGEGDVIPVRTNVAESLATMAELSDAKTRRVYDRAMKELEAAREQPRELNHTLVALPLFVFLILFITLSILLALLLLR